jgi:hypothetical protein
MTVLSADTVVSIVLALTTLPALLAVAGPAVYKPSIRRFFIALIVLALLCGLIVLALWAAAQHDMVRGPEGEPLSV